MTFSCRHPHLFILLRNADFHLNEGDELCHAYSRIIHVSIHRWPLCKDWVGDFTQKQENTDYLILATSKGLGDLSSFHVSENYHWDGYYKKVLYLQFPLIRRKKMRLVP